MRRWNSVARLSKVGRVELERSEAAVEQLVVLESEHGGLQLGVVLQEGGLELLVLDLCLVEHDDRADIPVADDEVDVLEDLGHPIEPHFVG